MHADYARNHEETLATSPQIVSFSKKFAEIEGDFRLFDSNRERGGGFEESRIVCNLLTH